jgi:predicted nucleic acid-binding protein
MRSSANGPYLSRKAADCAIATADLLIGATALHFGFAVGTRNMRHFKMIPGLSVLGL